MCLRRFSELLKQSGQYLYSVSITILYGYYSFWVLSVKSQRESSYTIINICSFIEKLFTLRMFWCDSLTYYVRLTSHKTLENYLINHSYLGLTKNSIEIKFDSHCFTQPPSWTKIWKVIFRNIWFCTEMGPLVTSDKTRCCNRFYHNGVSHKHCSTWHFLRTRSD